MRAKRRELYNRVSIVGQKHHQNLNSRENFRNIRPSSFRHTPQSVDSSILGEFHVIPVTIIKRWVFKISFSMVSNVTDSMAQFKPTQRDFRQRYLCETHFSRKYLAFSKCPKKFSNDCSFWVFLIYIDKRIDRYLGGILRYSVDFLKKLILLLSYNFDSLLALLIGHPYSYQNRSNRPNRLNPCSGILLRIESIEQYEQSPTQRANSQK